MLKQLLQRARPTRSGREVPPPSTSPGLRTVGAPKPLPIEVRQLWPEDITRSFWRFSNSKGQTHANLSLRPDGSVGSYAARNESSWRRHETGIEFLDPDGRVTSILHLVSPTRLEGPVMPTAQFFSEGLRHILERVDPDYPLAFVWNQATHRFLDKSAIFVRHIMTNSGVYRDGQRVTVDRPVFVEPEATMPYGRFITMGAFSYFAGDLSGDVASVGRYCSIADGIAVMGDSHPLDRITTHPFTYFEAFDDVARNRYGAELRREHHDRFQAPITIGNDVWIGENATFAGGIHVGDGAVVASRAVVTKDVEPYTIVGGIPARKIRRRFDDLTCRRLQDSRWWQYNFVDLPPDWSQPDRFVTALERRRSLGTIEPWGPEPIEIGVRLLESSMTY